VHNGEQTRFWEDWWLSNGPLMKQFPALFNIARTKNQTVASMLSTTPLNIFFRRALVGDKLRMWLELVALLVNVNLSDAEDNWEWKLGKNSAFSVMTMYNDLMIADKVHVVSPIWKLKLPLKISLDVAPHKRCYSHRRQSVKKKLER
jgi:hypothetical protein